MAGTCSIKIVFLEILQNSQQNNCPRVPFLMACNFIKKETLAQAFSCEFCEILNTFFTPLDDWLYLDLTSLLQILAEKKHRQIKLPTLSKSMNINIWLVDTSNQLVLRVSTTTKIKFSKKESSYWQNSVLCDRSIF